MNKTWCDFSLLNPALLLIILICLIYSNTLDSPWILDDYYNITDNPRIHIARLDIDSVKNAAFGAPIKTGGLYRPVAYLTFGLNWYWGQGNVTGYHVVNIVIHTLTAFFLFLALLQLLQTPNLGTWQSNGIYFVALLSAVLWAIHPIQIQAVTYIVQRMTAMAALFYVIGIFSYLKARLALTTISRIIFFGICGLAFMLGLGSKNNAIVLPVSLVLLEFIFFRDLTQKKTQRQAIAVIGIGAFLVAAVGVFIFMDSDLHRFLKGYENRPFTFYERLLTQPRVVLFYLSQIFYPIADRFSISHDFAVSTSLFTPWTTLPSILMVFLMIGLALWHIKKNPLLSFAFLFFFGNHFIESSIIPLEMVFEHRNYLPSLFLFVPVSVGIKKIIDHYYHVQKPMFYFLVISVCTGLIGIGTSTYIRNWDWRTVKSLWEDAMEKAPNSARPLQNLAWGYYVPTGQIKKAIDLYQKALDLQGNQTKFKYFSYNNLADIYYSKLQDYEKAIEYAQKTIGFGLDRERVYLLLCQSLGKLGRYDEAMKLIKPLVLQNPTNAKYHYVIGFMLLKMSQYEEAHHHFKKCVQIDPENWKYLREIGICLTRMGYYERGYWYLKRAESTSPKQTGVLFAISENRIEAGNPEEAAEWIDLAIEPLSAGEIEKMLMDNANEALGISVSHETVIMISKRLNERANEYTQTAMRLTSSFNSSI